MLQEKEKNPPQHSLFFDPDVFQFPKLVTKNNHTPESRRPGLAFWLCPFPAMWFWAIYLSSLSLSILIFKMSALKSVLESWAFSEVLNAN